MAAHDVVVIGAGPNGLAAAIELARRQLSVLVLEAESSPGGGARSEELTLPGFLHDACSSVFPLSVASPFFRSFPARSHGLSFIESPAALVHVLDGERAISLERSMSDTTDQLGSDGLRYRRLLAPLVERFDELAGMVLGPLRWPSAPVLMGRFGLEALRSLEGLCASHFGQVAAPALLAGIAAHAMLPLDAAATASFGLILAAAGHAVGWPIARGGAQSITTALCAELEALGGKLITSHKVRSFAELPPARAYVFDVTPRQLISIAGSELPLPYLRKLEEFRYGPGVFKIDWALAEPIPWKHAACRRAATVHLAGDIEAISRSEAAVHAGRLSERPFVLLVQPSLFDASRAPPGRHTAWAYCHVPHGSEENATAQIEAQVERFAPGFHDVVLARAVRNAVEMQAYDENYTGGDINGGASDLGQLFFRPVASLDPYATPARHIFICSSSTPPGGGVHGMCGYWAARSVLSHVFGIAAGERWKLAWPFQQQELRSNVTRNVQERDVRG